jgi:hypothetical protein
VVKFKYLETTVTKYNYTHKKIKRRLNLGNACYHSLQNNLYSFFLSIYVTILLPIVLYGCGTWSVTLKEECRLGVFEKRVLRILDLRDRKWQDSEEKYIMRNFIICSPHCIFLG